MQPDSLNEPVLQTARDQHPLPHHHPPPARAPLWLLQGKQAGAQTLKLKEEKGNPPLLQVWDQPLCPLGAQLLHLPKAAFHHEAGPAYLEGDTHLERHLPTSRCLWSREQS